MKKTGMIFLITALALAPVFAAPTEKEVEDTLGGVLMVFAIVLMSSTLDMTPEGAETVLDMERGYYSLVCDKLDVTAILQFQVESDITVTMNGLEDLPSIEFTEMSGNISDSGQGSVKLDVQLTGGSVKSLVLEMEEKNVVTFEANGKDYKSLAQTSFFTEMFGE